MADQHEYYEQNEDKHNGGFIFSARSARVFVVLFVCSSAGLALGTQPLYSEFLGSWSFLQLDQLSWCCRGRGIFECCT